MSECSRVEADGAEAIRIQKELDRYEKLDKEAEEIAEEDRIYRKAIVK